MASEPEYHDDFQIIPQFVWPDTNFTNVTFGFPSSPTSQVLANGHLYVAFGSYLGIYEVQPNGTLVETCLKMMPQHMFSIDHNGEHLFPGRQTSSSAPWPIPRIPLAPALLTTHSQT